MLAEYAVILNVRALASLEGCAAGKISPSPFETRPRGRSSGRRQLLLTRLRILDVELAHRARDDEIIVVEHQRPRHAVLIELERHCIDRGLLAVFGFGVAVVIAHRDRPS